MDKLVVEALHRVQHREMANGTPTIVKAIADRLLSSIKPKPKLVVAAKSRAAKRDPNIRTLLHSKNPLDKFQGAMDDVFGSDMVSVADPRRAVKEVTSKGDVFRSLYTATLPSVLTAENLDGLVQIFDRHSLSMGIRSIGVADDGSLILTVIMK
jgi:hypothetical protein